jgi:predicted permease
MLSIGVETALWTLGVMTLTGASARQSWRRIINAPLVAILIALGLNGTGLATHVPEVIHTGLKLLGQCAVPMALILIGAIVADHLHEFHSASGWRVIGSAVLLRVGLLPILFLLVAKFLPASLELKRVIVLEAAMPAAVFPIVMARHYAGDPATAMRVVIGTTVVGLVTIPLWIRFGMQWLGL